MSSRWIGILIIFRCCGRMSIPTRASTSIAPIGSFLERSRVPLILAIVGFVGLFWPTLVAVVEYWSRHDEFSHGFLVPIISAAILYGRRREIAQLPRQHDRAGAFLLATGLLLFAAGRLTAIHSVERLALWMSIVGAVWFATGRAFMRAHPFPFFFLLFCIPPPNPILEPVRIGLKSIATSLSAELLLRTGVPAFPEGNVLLLGSVQLEVADACSGIRSLVAITATSTLMAYLFALRWPAAILLTLTAVPVTIAVNVVRICVVAACLHKFNIDLTSGFAHDAVGVAVFVLSLLLLFAGYRFFAWVFPPKPQEGEVL